MNTTHSVKGLIPALLLLLSTTSEAVEVKLEFLPQDAMPKMGGYRPQKAPTFALQPASISQTPPEIADAEFTSAKVSPNTGRILNSLGNMIFSFVDWERNLKSTLYTNHLRRSCGIINHC